MDENKFISQLCSSQVYLILDFSFKKSKEVFNVVQKII